MTTPLITFSDESMSRSARALVDSVRNRDVSWAMTYNPAQVDLLAVPFPALRSLMKQARGIGYWAWKPFIIWETLKALKDGDILIYSDAGVEFINNVNHIIDRMDQDIFLFGNNWEHAHWCKRDIVEAVWPMPIDRQGFIDAGAQMSTPSNLVAFDIDGIETLYTWARFGKQCQSSVIFFRVSDYTRKFVKEWLDWCLFEGGRLIDDSPSGTPNHPEFQENRHDQAILTTMAYREGIKLHYWPATYNDGAFNYEKLPEYAGDDYPILFHHHRRRNHEWINARNS
jgi:hypothetical protein